MPDVFAMHIPDGFLSGRSPRRGGAGAGRRRLRAAASRTATSTSARVPLLGVTAAFVFAAQMLNFPVAGGTSGHLLGAALAAVLLGPWLACLVLAVVLAAQAFVFADGGITALGANVLNMGVIGALLAGVLVGPCVRVAADDPHRLPRPGRRSPRGSRSWRARRRRRRARDLSGTVPLETVLPAMLGVHALIGVGEAVITVAAVSAVLATRPDLIAVAARRSTRGPARPREA